jgi:hypothetical protein
MEKNIDELLNSLKHADDKPTGFSEEHRIFIQFILSPKGRSKFKTSSSTWLMDAKEYSFMNPLIYYSHYF